MEWFIHKLTKIEVIASLSFLFKPLVLSDFLYSILAITDSRLCCRCAPGAQDATGALAGDRGGDGVGGQKVHVRYERQRNL